MLRFDGKADWSGTLVTSVNVPYSQLAVVSVSQFVSASKNTICLYNSKQVLKMDRRSVLFFCLNMAGEYLWKHSNPHPGWPLLFTSSKRATSQRQEPSVCHGDAAPLPHVCRCWRTVSPGINRWVFYSSWWELSPSVPRINSFKMHLWVNSSQILFIQFCVNMLS